MSETVVELPRDLRSELKEPLGPIFTDADALLAEASEPLLAVGDIVTYHLLSAGYTPTLALVDEQTKRSAVDSDVHEAVLGEGAASFDRRVTVENPAATLTVELLETIVANSDGTETTLVVVDGEEDLAVLPAVLVAPLGASIVYGQPEEGMVLVTVDEQTRERARSLLERMDGDTDRLFSILS